jgi:hypothetical protein
MMSRTPPRLLKWMSALLSDDSEALVGDLFEGYQSGRSDVWLWRQMTWAIVTRGLARERRRQRADATTHASVTDVAIVAVVAFEAVVAATLLDLVHGVLASVWTATIDPLLVIVGAVALAIVGSTAGILRARRRHGRLGTAMCYGVGMTALAWLTLIAMQPEAPRGFLPSPPIQIGMAFLCLIGLLGWPRQRQTAE